MLLMPLSSPCVVVLCFSNCLICLLCLFLIPPIFPPLCYVPAIHCKKISVTEKTKIDKAKWYLAIINFIITCAFLTMNMALHFEKVMSLPAQ